MLMSLSKSLVAWQGPGPMEPTRFPATATGGIVAHIRDMIWNILDMEFARNLGYGLWNMECSVQLAASF